MWQIAPDIRAMVKYQQLNLLADFSQLGMFDLIFCRNVLIYFDQDDQNRCARSAGAASSLATAISSSARPKRWSGSPIASRWWRISAASMRRIRIRRGSSAADRREVALPRLVAVNGGR